MSTAAFSLISWLKLLKHWFSLFPIFPFTHIIIHIHRKHQKNAFTYHLKQYYFVQKKYNKYNTNWNNKQKDCCGWLNSVNLFLVLRFTCVVVLWDGARRQATNVPALHPNLWPWLSTINYALCRVLVCYCNSVNLATTCASKIIYNATWTIGDGRACVFKKVFLSKWPLQISWIQMMKWLDA